MKRPDSNTREGRKWFTPSLGGGRGEARRAFTPLLALLAVFVLGSCTILDNDLRGLSDAPGFKSVVHEETDEYTCEYQYRPEVTYVDDYLAPYITSISEDYSTLYLADYIPDNYLPVPGELLASLATDKLTYGMQHRVLSVTKGNGLYAVKLERAALEDIFSHFVFNMNYDENIDPSEYNYDPDIEEEINTNIPNQAPARRATTDIDWDNWEPKLKRIDQDHNCFNKIPPFKLDVTASGNLDESKKDVVKVSGSVTLSVMFGIMPYIEPVLHIDMNEKQYDLGCIFGFFMQAGASIKGKGQIDIDIVQWYKNVTGKDNKENEKKLEKTIKVKPGGVPLKITIVPVIKWENSIDASSPLDTEMSIGKFFGTGISWGMPKRENGPYWRSIESVKDAYFSLPTQAGFTSHFKVGAKINITLDCPDEDVLDVGLELTPTIGPKIRMGSSSKSKNPYYSVFHTGLPLELGSKAYVKLFECLKYEFNITDFVKKLFGSTSNTDVVGEILAKDWPYYPYVENMSFLCRNQKSWEPPIFDMSFDLKKSYLSSTTMEHTHPEVRVYKSEDINIMKLDETADPVFSKEPVAEKVFDKLKSKDVNSFKWTIDAILERDKTYYAVLYYINDQPLPNEDRILYSHAYPFSSQSPTLELFDHDMTAQHYYYYRRSGVEHYYYDFKFRTYVQPWGTNSMSADEIKEWGFQVGNKTYSIKKPINGGIKNVLWFIKKSDKGNRTLVFRPYVKFDLEGAETTNWGTAYTVNLKYDESLNEGEDQFYKTTTEKDKDGKTFKADWYVRGFDKDSSYGEIDYDLSGETMRAPKVTMTPMGDGDDLPADYDDYDDLEIEIVEVE